MDAEHPLFPRGRISLCPHHVGDPGRFWPSSKKGTSLGTSNDLNGYDRVIGDEAFWQIRAKVKFNAIPKDAQTAFCGQGGVPYRAWKEIIVGNWQPRVAFLEGKFFSVTWDVYEATREEMPTGSWLVEDRNGGIRIISEEYFVALYES